MSSGGLANYIDALIVAGAGISATVVGYGLIEKMKDQVQDLKKLEETKYKVCRIFGPPNSAVR